MTSATAASPPGAPPAGREPIARPRRTTMLLKNPYEVEAVRDGSRRVIRRMRITNTWFTGEPRAIFG
jgi:hypothetical protein